MCAPYLSSTWQHGTPFVSIIQPALNRPTRPLATRRTLSFTRTYKIEKPDPVWSKALIQQNRLIGIIDVSQMWLLGPRGRTASSLIHQGMLSRAMVRTGWHVRYIGNTRRAYSMRLINPSNWITSSSFNASKLHWTSTDSFGFPYA